jgi:hypothetical protein
LIRAEWIKKDTGRRAGIYELTIAGTKQCDFEESRWHTATCTINRFRRSQN